MRIPSAYRPDPGTREERSTAAPCEDPGGANLELHAEPERETNRGE